MNRIVWLASYPKSGNTWLRVFLANFLSGGSVEVDVSALEFGPMASRRDAFDDVLGVESSNFTEAEIDLYRSAAFRQMAARSSDTLFLKTHDAYTTAPGGEPRIPAEVTRMVFYVARNPLDVAVSAAHQWGISLDQSIDHLGVVDLAVHSNPRRLYGQLKERYLSWSAHVSSWLDQRAVPVHLLRYEDMLSRPYETFGSVVRLLGFGDDEERVEKALGFSSFERLQRQEQLRGFRDRPSTATASFFRQGRAGQWREILTDNQVARVIREHGDIMGRLGYRESGG